MADDAEECGAKEGRAGNGEAPAARHGAAGHGEMAAEDDPVGDVVSRHQAAGDEGGGDDAHALLGVVGAMTKAIARGRKKLQAAKQAVDSEGALAADEPTG